MLKHIPCRGLVEARRITTLGDAVLVLDDDGSEKSTLDLMDYLQAQQNDLSPGQYIILVPHSEVPSWSLPIDHDVVRSASQLRPLVCRSCRKVLVTYEDRTEPCPVLSIP